MCALKPVKSLWICTKVSLLATLTIMMRMSITAFQERKIDSSIVSKPKLFPKERWYQMYWEQRGTVPSTGDCLWNITLCNSDQLSNERNLIQPTFLLKCNNYWKDHNEAFGDRSLCVAGWEEVVWASCVPGCVTSMWGSNGWPWYITLSRWTENTCVFRLPILLVRCGQWGHL